MNVEQLLSTYPPAVQAIALKVRAVVQNAFPEAGEWVDPPDKLIAYGSAPTYKGMICMIAPFKDSVNLGFIRGTQLPDPTHLLRGTGKWSRHIKFKTLDEVDNPAVRDLIEAALADYQKHI